MAVQAIMRVTNLATLAALAVHDFAMFLYWLYSLHKPSVMLFSLGKIWSCFTVDVYKY